LILPDFFVPWKHQNPSDKPAKPIDSPDFGPVYRFNSKKFPIWILYQFCRFSIKPAQSDFWGYADFSNPECNQNHPNGNMYPPIFEASSTPPRPGPGLDPPPNRAHHHNDLKIMHGQPGPYPRDPMTSDPFPSSRVALTDLEIAQGNPLPPSLHPPRKDDGFFNERPDTSDPPSRSSSRPPAWKNIVASYSNTEVWDSMF
jgi:hypothetical protein